MRNKLLLTIVIIELILLVLINPKSTNKNSFDYSINIYKESNLDQAKLENYIIGVVAAEMPATFSIESLKAQAVAARTFTYKKIINNQLNYNNLSTDKGQAYYNLDQLKKNWGNKYDEYYDKIASAVLSTKGEVITYNGELINAYYFSISNGKTEDSKEVFGEASYLVSVESPWDKNYSSYNNKVKINLDEFKNKLNIKNDVTINEIKKTTSDHVDYIIINNQKYDGVKFRKLLDLRSTDFEIDFDENYATITTKGHGHSVGMSQYGANSMAKEGKTYQDIIRYYYQGVKIEKI